MCLYRKFEIFRVILLPLNLCGEFLYASMDNMNETKNNNNAYKTVFGKKENHSMEHIL